MIALKWELWRRGSVVGSWLLDLTADVLRGDRELSKFDGGVSDSGEGRWTVHAAVDLGVPAPVISSALYERFGSRQLGRFANKVLNGMRAMFGGRCQIKLIGFVANVVAKDVNTVIKVGRNDTR